MSEIVFFSNVQKDEAVFGLIKKISASWGDMLLFLKEGWMRSFSDSLISHRWHHSGLPVKEETAHWSWTIQGFPADGGAPHIVNLMEKQQNMSVYTYTLQNKFTVLYICSKPTTSLYLGRSRRPLIKHNWITFHCHWSQNCIFGVGLKVCFKKKKESWQWEVTPFPR